jgi:hypothetical protein
MSTRFATVNLSLVGVWRGQAIIGLLLKIVVVITIYLLYKTSQESG